jgi:hypothetical protein
MCPTKCNTMQIYISLPASLHKLDSAGLQQYEGEENEFQSNKLSGTARIL